MGWRRCPAGFTDRRTAGCPALSRRPPGRMTFGAARHMPPSRSQTATNAFSCAPAGRIRSCSDAEIVSLLAHAGQIVPLLQRNPLLPGMASTASPCCPAGGSGHDRAPSSSPLSPHCDGRNAVEDRTAAFCVCLLPVDRWRHRCGPSGRLLRLRGVPDRPHGGSRIPVSRGGTRTSVVPQPCPPLHPRRER